MAVTLDGISVLWGTIINLAVTKEMPTIVDSYVRQQSFGQ